MEGGWRGHISFLATGGYRQKVAFTRTWPCLYLDFRLAPPRIVRDDCLLFKLPSLWNFPITAWPDIVALILGIINLYTHTQLPVKLRTEMTGNAYVQVPSKETESPQVQSNFTIWNCSLAWSEFWCIKEKSERGTWVYNLPITNTARYFYIKNENKLFVGQTCVEGGLGINQRSAQLVQYG